MLGVTGMHFLLLLVRLILDRFVPDWRDGLRMAIRKDGRIEHLPARPGFWSQCIRVLEESTVSPDPKPKKPRAACGCARPASPGWKAWLRN
jgi:hypothetical protein